MALTELDWPRLKEVLREELENRHWTQAHLARQAGVTLRSIQTLLSGERRRRMPTCVRGVESAFGWPRGAIHAILEGGPPPGRSDGLDIGPLAEDELWIWEKTDIPEHRRKALILAWRSIKAIEAIETRTNTH